MRLVRQLVVLDLETTGIWIEKDKIIEIAMIKISPDQSKETYCKRLNPGMPIPPRISELVGITDADVATAPSFKDIAKEIAGFIKGADFAGFNIERFDLPLLRRELNDAGVQFDWQECKIYDAQKVYHLNEKRDLTAAYQFYCQKDLEGAHSALVDTQATLEILEAQIHKYGEGKEDIEILSEYDYINHVEYYDDDRKFRWWNGKLYMMFGKYAKQYSLQDIVKKDRAYMEWIVSANFSAEVKELVTNALNGQFPRINENKKIEWSAS